MFCVQKFTSDMPPAFTEDMIIKHSLMKSVLWGNSFSVICVNLRISLGNQLWSILSREGSFLCASCTMLTHSAFAPTMSPQAWLGACFFSIWRMQVPRALQIPVVLFPFGWSHKRLILWVGARLFSGLPLSWVSNAGSWERFSGPYCCFGIQS